MNCLDALAEIDAELNELTHPLGSIAYQKAVAQRVEPSGRDVLAYDDAPAPPLMDDELAKAKERGEADEFQGLLYGRDKAPAEGKKRKGRDGGVALPKWMDLDQETLPNAPTVGARAKRPPALDAFGGVGELTVQARLARERGEKTWGSPPEGYVCHICQEPGHWIEHCPHAQPRSSAATRPPAEGGGGGSGDGDGAGRAPKSQRTAPLSAEQRVAAARGRPPAGYVCNLCHEHGHWIAQCPHKERATPPAGYLCHRCHQAGHWRHLCPAAEPRAPRASASASAELAPPLVVEAEHELAGDEIAEALDEEAADVRRTLARAVAALGEGEARQLLVQTWQVEEQGGLLTVDGTSRRRSPGGVFLWLIKQAASPVQRLQIWPPASPPGGGADTAVAGKGGGRGGGRGGGKGGKIGGKGGSGKGGGGKGSGGGGKKAAATVAKQAQAPPLVASGDPAASPGAADPAGGDDWADDLAAMLEARGDELRGGTGGRHPGAQWELTA